MGQVHVHSIRDFSWLVNVFGYQHPEQAEACALACEWLYWACNYRVLKIFSQPLRGLLIYARAESIQKGF